MKKKSPMLIVCGPTATGKTGLGIFLAKKLNGEIISADSRQVYKGMDIGTGKEISNFLPRRQAGKFQISNEIKRQNFQIGFYEINGVLVWLYDVVDPNQTFSAVEYANLAKIVIDNIYKRGKTPIVVGGTGFYIKVLIDDIETKTKADWQLRKKLEKYNVVKLQNLLKNLDENRLKKMNNSDKNNPRRLIRAIEILKNSNFKIQNSKQNSEFKTVFVGLKTDNKKLYKRIDERVEKRIKQGILEEIKNLLKKGYRWKDPGMNALGYKEWKEYFKNKNNKEEAAQKWKFAEHAYARRQMTWFKKDKRIKWFNIEKLKKEDVLSFVKKKLK